MDRRSYLVVGGSILSLGVSGCSLATSNPETDRETQVEDEWLRVPDPGQFGIDQYGFRFVDVQDLLDPGSTASRNLFDGYEEMIGVGGAAFERIDRDVDAVSLSLSARQFAVFDGLSDRDAAIAALESSGYVDTADGDSPPTYASEDVDEDVAVRFDDERVVVAGDAVLDDGDVRSLGTSERSPRALVERVADAAAGRADTYADGNPAVERLTDRFADRLAAWIYPHSRTDRTDVDAGEFAGEVPRGTGFEVGASRTDVERVLVFASDASPRSLRWKRGLTKIAVRG